jgi:hypothetical protein
VERAVVHLERYAAVDGPTYGLELGAVVDCVRQHVAREA